MASPRLLLVGASVRAAAQSALRAGYLAAAFDAFADADLERLCPATRLVDYPGGFGRAMREEPADGWMYTGRIENYPQLLSEWARARPLWGNDVEALAGVRCPWRWSQALGGAGVRCPQLARTVDELQQKRQGPREASERYLRSDDFAQGDAGSEAPVGRWLVKPLASRRGGRIRFATPQENQAADAADGEYFQQFVEGPSYAGVYVASRGEARLLGVTRQLIGADWLGAAAFSYCGSIGPVALAPALAAAFARMGSALAAAFPLRGLFGVDTIIRDQAVWPVEINPRHTASVELLERATGLNAIALHVRACREGWLPPESQYDSLPAAAGRGISPAAAGLCGKAVVFARRTQTISDETSARWLARATSAAADRADVPRPGVVVEPGDPIITVFAAGSTVDETLAGLKRQAAQVEAEL